MWDFMSPLATVGMDRGLEKKSSAFQVLVS